MRGVQAQGLLEALLPLSGREGRVDRAGTMHGKLDYGMVGGGHKMLLYNDIQIQTLVSTVYVVQVEAVEEGQGRDRLAISRMLLRTLEEILISRDGHWSRSQQGYIQFTKPFNVALYLCFSYN